MTQTKKIGRPRKDPAQVHNYQILVSLPHCLKAFIQDMAESERRSVSAMASIILEDALKQKLN